MENKPGTPSLNRFPLSDALDCIAYYKDRASGKGIDGTKLIKAYLVKKQDMMSTLGISASNIPNSHYDYVRVYIGMERTSLDTDAVYKLFLTPVKDITAITPGGTDVILKGYIRDGDVEEADYVYDFNLPCPNTCDPRSPLFLAGE